jgi:hypothetical protein
MGSATTRYISMARHLGMELPTSASVIDRIAAVVSARKSSDTVAAFVEWYYALTSSTLAELVSYARNREHNPYPASTRRSSTNVPHGDRITCGHHPWLYARKVKNLVVEAHSDSGLEIVEWTEPPIFRWRPDGSFIEEAIRPRADSISRVVRGQLATQAVEAVKLT